MNNSGDGNYDSNDSDSGDIDHDSIVTYEVGLYVSLIIVFIYFIVQNGIRKETDKFVSLIRCNVESTIIEPEVGSLRIASL